MTGFLEKITGSLDEKREWKRNDARGKALPGEYAIAYDEMKKYMFGASGAETIAPYKALVDMLEEAAENGRHVLDITGPDVASFVDELVHGEKTYFQEQRDKLNRNIAKKLSK